MRTGAHAEVRALIGEGRFGMHFDKAAHGIASVERTLRAAQNVDTLNVGIAEVEGGLVDVRDIVYIQSHGRGVDARADTADINGGSKP